MRSFLKIKVFASNKQITNKFRKSPGLNSLSGSHKNIKTNNNTYQMSSDEI